MIYRSYEKVTGTFYEPKQQADFPDIADYDTETQNDSILSLQLNLFFQQIILQLDNEY